jgi:hypothetical protein
MILGRPVNGGRSWSDAVLTKLSLLLGFIDLSLGLGFFEGC